VHHLFVLTLFLCRQQQFVELSLPVVVGPLTIVQSSTKVRQLVVQSGHLVTVSNFQLLAVFVP